MLNKQLYKRTNHSKETAPPLIQAYKKHIAISAIVQLYFIHHFI